MSDELAEQVTGIGALAEPARRALYLYVASQPEAVSREQAAAAVGMPLHSAKFHLDRLVEEDLLEVEFRRLSGRTGPGAGRPSKLYRRSSRQLSVSLPERRYDLAGDVLASAIDRSLRDGVPIAEAVREAAAAEGRSIAGAFLEGTPSQPATSASEGGAAGHDDSGLSRTADVLALHGYEPRTFRRRDLPGQLPVRPARDRAHRAGLRHEPRPDRRGHRRARRLGGLRRARAAARLLLRQGLRARPTSACGGPEQGLTARRVQSPVTSGASRAAINRFGAIAR